MQPGVMMAAVAALECPLFRVPSAAVDSNDLVEGPADRRADPQAAFASYAYGFGIPESGDGEFRETVGCVAGMAEPFTLIAS